MTKKTEAATVLRAVAAAILFWIAGQLLIVAGVGFAGAYEFLKVDDRYGWSFGLAMGAMGASFALSLTAIGIRLLPCREDRG